MEDKNLSPLESVLVTCSACQKSFLQHRLNPQAYRVTASDTDFYPSQRIWLAANHSDLNPLTFFMQTCPSCFFTLEANGHSNLKSAQLVPIHPEFSRGICQSEPVSETFKHKQ